MAKDVLEGQMKYPDVIFATEKIGSNGIRCLDYKNKDDDVKYIRADLVKLQNTSSNSDYRRNKMAKDKCTLTDAELIEKAHDWISKLAKTGGREWCLRVPVDFNHDPDMIFSELCNRLECAKNAEQANQPDKVKECTHPYPDMWIVVNIGCIECGVSSNIVGVFDSQEKAEQVAEKCGEKYNWREGGQNSFDVFPLPEANKINEEYNEIGI